jgi:Xaa-Pro aminopeptidase
MDYASRQTRLREALAKHRLHSMLVTHLPNVRYLSGFTGSAAVLWISEGESFFYSDGRYREQASQEVRGARVEIVRKSLVDAVAESITRKLRRRKGITIGLEAQHISMANGQRLRQALGGVAKLREAPALVENLRLRKDGDELAAIRKAVELGAALFDCALKNLRSGVSETFVAGEMESAARRGGADGMSFDTIVAAGPRSALPHGRASQATIPTSGFVVCDFGVILHGYCSDRTRTVWVGTPTTDAREAYSAVLDAQLAAIDAVKPGVSLQKVDSAARNVLKKKGLAKFFTHSTGHGVGLEVHEAPRVAQGQRELLQPGMVITIEPGIYIPGQWGIRIEDMVVVTEKGCEVLTPARKEFIAI